MTAQGPKTSTEPLRSAPIFIGGDHRSGTTLLSLMLDSHGDAVCGPEIDFLEPVDLGDHILRCIDLVLAGDPRVEGRGASTADPEWQPGVQFVRQCHRFGIPPDDLGGLVRRELGTSDAPIATFAERCRLIDRLGEWRRDQVAARRWGMKIQRQIRFADRFATQWPDAYFLHIVRDGRDVAASHLVGGQPWTYPNIEQAAYGWVDVVEQGHAVAPRDHSLAIRYEDLVHDPAATMLRVLESVQLPWDDRVLRHASVPHSLLEHSYGHPTADAAGRDVYGHAVGRFRHDLSPTQIATFEELAGDTLRRLGYEATPER